MDIGGQLELALESFLLDEKILGDFECIVGFGQLDVLLGQALDRLVVSLGQAGAHHPHHLIGSHGVVGEQLVELVARDFDQLRIFGGDHAGPCGCHPDRAGSSRR